MEFLKLQSYIGMQSGEITMEKILSPEVFEGRHVLVVEDIHDTGKTLKKIIEELQKLNTAKVDIAVLVRRTENPFEIDLKFTGIVCSEFIIGYGLDYNGLAR